MSRKIKCTCGNTQNPDYHSTTTCNNCGDTLAYRNWSSIKCENCGCAIKDSFYTANQQDEFYVVTAKLKDGTHKEYDICCNGCLWEKEDYFKTKGIKIIKKSIVKNS